MTVHIWIYTLVDNSLPFQKGGKYLLWINSNSNNVMILLILFDKAPGGAGGGWWVIIFG